MQEQKSFVRNELNNVVVAEFSLTNEARDELAGVLKDSVEGDATENPTKIKRAIKKCLGELVIEELKTLKKKDRNNKTVYVIHNLPEMSDVDARKRIGLEHFDGESNYNFYNTSFTRYLGEIIGCKKDSSTFLKRKPREEVFGGEYHDHPSYKASAIGGIISDGAPTEFTNLNALKADSSAAEIEVYPEGRSEKVKLLNLETNKADDLEFTIQDKDQGLFDKYSHKVIVGKQDLILWSEQGALLHRAVLAKKDGAAHDPEEINRAVMVYGMGKIAR